MNCFELSECSDNLLKLTEDDRQEAGQYIDALVTRLGVKPETVKTVPYELKQLAMAVACRIRARIMSGRGNGIKEVDVYMAKYRIYDSEARHWESLITPELLKGRSQSESLSPSFSIRRC